MALVYVSKNNDKTAVIQEFDPRTDTVAYKVSDGSIKVEKWPDFLKQFCSLANSMSSASA